MRKLLILVCLMFVMSFGFCDENDDLREYLMQVASDQAIEYIAKEAKITEEQVLHCLENRDPATMRLYATYMAGFAKGGLLVLSYIQNMVK